MKPFKPPSVIAEEKLDKMVAVPKVMKAPIEMKPAPAPKQPVAAADLEMVLIQLQNIWEKIIAIELIVTAQFKTAGVVDDTHPAPYPVTTNGGHPVLPNGMTAKFVEVPTVEQLLARARTFSEKNGKDALTALVRGFGVKKISELGDEDRAKLMERLNG
jgi:hypothetical protein